MQDPTFGSAIFSSRARWQRAFPATLRQWRLLSLLAAPVGVACAPPFIPPERIAKVEVRNLTSSEKMIEGDEARKLFEGMVCHEGDFQWKGGYPATIYLDNGRDREVDGFSYYERVLRISRRQYCDLGEGQWKAVFGELLPR